MGTVCEGDSFLFLDDMYHIRKVDQPNVIDYFHRIAKGNNPVMAQNRHDPPPFTLLGTREW